MPSVGSRGGSNLAQEPLMAVEVVLPMLGITVERGRILKWHKTEGERVQKGEILFEVETEKVVTEVESPATGILARILVPEGVEAPLLTVVGLILQEGEKLPDSFREAPPEPSGRGQISHPGPGPTSKGPPTRRQMELAVLGGGPAGYLAAIRAAQRGARVLLIERDRVGGTCLHRGCIPTKCFLSDVELLQRVRGSELFSGTSALSLEIPRMVARKDEVVGRLHRGLARLLDGLGVEVVRGVGEILDANTVMVRGNGDGQLYEASHLLIATGSAPAPLGNLRADGQLVLYSDHLVDMGEVPGRMAVVGAGAIGLEWASIMRGLGTEVVVLEMLPRLLASGDQETATVLHRALETQNIRIITGAVVREVRTRGQEIEVLYRCGEESSSLRVDRVLLAVGRSPNTGSMGLERITLEKDGPFLRVDDRMCTTVPNIYAAGDVTGRAMLAHAAFWEADVAVRNILGESAQMDYKRVPRCVYTSPEVAWVGLSEEEARRAGYGVRVGKFPFGHNGKALALGDGEGLVKIVAEQELGQILGVSIVGPHATELLGECLLAMRLEASVEELADIIKPHPSLSEAIGEAAMGWLGRPIHASGASRP
jgi:dihydrolipoamide dehydrogenase